MMKRKCPNCAGDAWYPSRDTGRIMCAYCNEDLDAPLRVVVLHEAARLTGGARNQSYGAPRDNLANIAELWTSYLVTKYKPLAVDSDRFLLTAEDVAHMNVLMKIARTYATYKRDNYVDAAAYAAIAGECAKDS